MVKLTFIPAWTLILALFSCMPNSSDQKHDDGSSQMKEGESLFYSFKAKTLDGDTIDFARYKGKKVLIVNTASECGSTPQYADLQELHQKYGDKVTVLGFPCNQFGGQEPGTGEEIKSFCKLNYGVTFQMFEKTEVKGKNKSELYKWLTTKELNGWNDKEPSWNFCKYLVNEKGELVNFYGTATGPMNKKLIEEISK